MMIAYSTTTEQTWTSIVKSYSRLCHLPFEEIKPFIVPCLISYCIIFYIYISHVETYVKTKIKVHANLLKMLIKIP